MGLPLHMIQALGRWSSQAVLRYTQESPLQVLPQAASAALLQSGNALPDPKPVLHAAALQDQTAEEVSQPVERKRLPSPEGGTGSKPEGDQAQTDFLVVDSEAQGSSDKDLAATVAALQSDVTTLRAAVHQVQSVETFIVQGRSRKHHRPVVCEQANHPSTWRTACGWPYGAASFHRTFGLSQAANLCRRCFPDEAVVDSSSSSSGSSSSSSSSESDQ